MLRRIGGSVMMAAGGVAVVAMLALAAIVGANFVEPAAAGEGVATIAFIVAPPIIGGVVLIALGRLTFGDWRGAQPLRRWGGLAVFILGAGVGAALAVLLLLSLPRGFGADNQGVLILLALGALACALLAWLGRRLSRRASI